MPLTDRCLRRILAGSEPDRPSAAHAGGPPHARGPPRTPARLAVRPARHWRCTRSSCCFRSAMTVQYSLYRWDGIGTSQWVGLDNYVTCPHRPGPPAGDLQRLPADLSSSASSRSRSGSSWPRVIRRIATGDASGNVARTVLFLPQVIPLVAAGIAWSWVLSLDGRRQPGCCPRSGSVGSLAPGSATSTSPCPPSASSAPGCCSGSARSCCSPA